MNLSVDPVDTSSMQHASQPDTRRDGTVFSVLTYAYDDGIFVGRYRGVVGGDTAGGAVEFEERVDFGATSSAAVPSEALLRLLALACSLSYYKATYADTISVEFGLSVAERTYLAQLVEHGLGEYAYVNNMLWKLTPTLIADPVEPAEARESWNITDRPMVAVGGGKDSIVAIEALKSAGHTPLLFSVNDRGAIRATAEVAGCDHVTVIRRIAPELLAANATGAPNGHVPVTAINSLIGLVAAELAQCGALVFANEASADHGNLFWHGRTINHQWSKSLEHEDHLRAALGAAGLSPDRYFSLLRSYREIEIAQAFARYPQYFDDFTSCNRAYVIDANNRPVGWCGECAKCAFVYLILAPYIARDRLASIFKKDLLDDATLAPMYIDILGAGNQKPFDCVGEPGEAAEAFLALAADAQWQDARLVGELAPAFESFGEIETGRGEDRVPSPFAAARDQVASR